MAVLATAAAFTALVALLLVASVVDIRTRTIPNRLVLAVVALWLAWQGALAALGTASAAGFLGGLAGALLFGCALLAFVAVAERVSGKFMMGGGDVKLLAAVSLFLGFYGVLVALFCACLVSFAYAAARLKRGIPFAPCIASGTLLALLAL